MQFFQWLTDIGNRYIAEAGPTVNGETIPIMVLLLLGTGVFLTLRLGFIRSGGSDTDSRSRPALTTIRTSPEMSPTSRR